MVAARASAAGMIAAAQARAIHRACQSRTLTHENRRETVNEATPEAVMIDRSLNWMLIALGLAFHPIGAPRRAIRPRRCRPA